MQIQSIYISHFISCDGLTKKGQIFFCRHLLGIPYTHISSPMPDFYRSQKPMPRGVANRRAAIAWIRQNGKKPGVMYFGDDDNTFDLRLFNEIRYTKRVSMFPVGLIGQYSVSSPVVRHVSATKQHTC